MRRFEQEAQRRFGWVFRRIQTERWGNTKFVYTHTQFQLTLDYISFPTQVNLQAIEVLFSEADDAVFQRIINNNLRDLQTFFYQNHLKYGTILDADRTTNYWSLKLLTWANVILLSVYCIKTSIDIFTFYRFIIFTLFMLRVSNFLLKIMMMMMRPGIIEVHLRKTALGKDGHASELLLP